LKSMLEEGKRGSFFCCASEKKGTRLARPLVERRGGGEGACIGSDRELGEGKR